MAKIVFLSLFDVNSEGPRTLSAILRKHGHRPYMIFLKRYARKSPVSGELHETDWVGIDMRGRPFLHARGKSISDKEKNLCLQLIQQIRPDMIGMSVTTPLMRTSAELSPLIKKTFDIPLIWGGAAPIILWRLKRI
jgi:hypothetical protein